MQEGIEKGIEKGQTRLISSQMQLKFGTQAKEYEAILDKPNEKKLPGIAQHILSCNTVEEVFGGIESHE